MEQNYFGRKALVVFLGALLVFLTIAISSGIPSGDNRLLHFRIFYIGCFSAAAVIGITFGSSIAFLSGFLGVLPTLFFNQSNSFLHTIRSTYILNMLFFHVLSALLFGLFGLFVGLSFESIEQKYSSIKLTPGRKILNSVFVLFGSLMLFTVIYNAVLLIFVNVFSNMYFYDYIFSRNYTFSRRFFPFSDIVVFGSESYYLFGIARGGLWSHLYGMIVNHMIAMIIIIAIGAAFYFYYSKRLKWHIAKYLPIKNNFGK